MKNKILPLSLVTLVICLGAFLISATISYPDAVIPQGDEEGNTTLAAEQYMAKLRNNQVSGELPVLDVINAREQVNMIAAQGANREDIVWSFIGPDDLGGRTRAFVFDNTDENSNTIIAGAVSGGIYKSLNGGLTWSKINGEESNLNVSCMAQGPDGAIYVGTGEGFTVEQYSLFSSLNYNGAFVGTGIYKSTDSENFTLLPATAPAGNNDTLAFSFINRLAVNPSSGLVWAATHNGVYYSADAGDSWSLGKIGDTALLTGSAHDVKIGSDGITAVSIEGLAYISDNGDPNQFVLHSYDTFNLPYEDVGRTEFAIAPTDNDILYATVVNQEGGLVNVYRSDDRGVNWRIIAPGGSENLNFFSNTDETATGQGLYDNVLIVFPDDPDRVLLGGVNMWEGRKYSETGYFQWTQRSSGSIPEALPTYVPDNHHIYTFHPTTGEIYVGHDGGISVGTIGADFFEFVGRNKTYTTSQFSTVGMGGDLKKVLGGAHGAGTLLIDGNGNPATAQNGTQIFGGNGGPNFISLIDPLVFLYSDIPGDNFVRTEDEGENISTGFLPTSIIVPTNGYLTPGLYWESFENEFSRDSVEFKANTQLEAGSTVIVRSNNREYPFEYTLPNAMAPGDSMMVKDIVSTKYFLGVEDAVYMTTGSLDFTGEPEWFLIASLDESGFEGRAQAFGLSADANYLYVGTLEGQLYRIANIKYAYDFDRADVTSPFCVISTTHIPLIDPVTMEQNTQVITSVSVDPQDPSNVIVTLGNYGNNHYIYHTANGLDEVPSFTPVQGDLPKMPVYSSLIEMSNSNIALVGTDMGLYMTENLTSGSPNWTMMAEEIGMVPVFKLRQQIVAKEPVIVKLFNGVDTITETYAGTNNFGVIYAATYGRGLHLTRTFEKPVGIFTPDQEQRANMLKIFPNPVRNSTTIEFSLNEPAEVIISVFDINGKMVVSEKTYREAGTHLFKLDCSHLPRGTYVTSLHTGKTIETGKFIIAR